MSSCLLSCSLTVVHQAPQCIFSESFIPRVHSWPPRSCLTYTCQGPSELSLVLGGVFLPSITWCPEKSIPYSTQVPKDLGPIFILRRVLCCKQQRPNLANVNRTITYFKITRQFTQSVGGLANQGWRPQNQWSSPKSDCRNGLMKAPQSTLLDRETTACVAGSFSVVTRISVLQRGAATFAGSAPQGRNLCDFTASCHHLLVKHWGWRAMKRVGVIGRV